MHTGLRLALSATLLFVTGIAHAGPDDPPSSAAVTESQSAGTAAPDSPKLDNSPPDDQKPESPPTDKPQQPPTTGTQPRQTAPVGKPQAKSPQLANPRTDYTAYTRPSGTLALGPLKIEHGIIDEIMIGTYPLPWFAFPILKTPIPNGYLKLRSFWGGPFTLALGGGLTYIDGKAVAKLADKTASASALSTVAELDASYRFNERFTLSLGFDYAHLRAIGNSGDQATSVEGASTAHTYSTRLFGEWRLSRVFALTLLLRYLIYQSPVDANATSNSSSISVTANVSAQSTEQRHFTAVPGVSFVFDRWELTTGVGYGVFYLPVLGLASTKAWPVVDFSFAYRFDLY
jgi:hypothetical protein